jgi:tetratricopeptide (TPR) repeat protein
MKLVNIIFAMFCIIFILSCTGKNKEPEKITFPSESISGKEASAKSENMKNLLLKENYGYERMTDNEGLQFELSKEYYFEGLRLYQNNEIEMALLKFEQALQTSSNKGAYYYHYGLCLMDLKDYVNAEKAFLRAIKFCPSVSHSSFYDEYMNNTLYTFDENGVVREKYLSYYNIACIYSITNNLEASLEKLKEALEYGYLYINYLFDDPDLKNLFNKSIDIKNEISDVYENGFINTVLRDSYHYVYGSNELFYFIKDEENITRRLISTTHPVFYGTYEIKNYHIIIKYYKETGERGLGDIIIAIGNGEIYERYEPYEQEIERYEILSIKEISTSHEWEKMK